MIPKIFQSTSPHHFNPYSVLPITERREKRNPPKEVLEQIELLKNFFVTFKTTLEKGQDSWMQIAARNPDIYAKNIILDVNRANIAAKTQEILRKINYFFDEQHESDFQIFKPLFAQFNVKHDYKPLFDLFKIKCGDVFSFDDISSPSKSSSVAKKMLVSDSQSSKNKVDSISQRTKYKRRCKKTERKVGSKAQKTFSKKGPGDREPISLPEHRSKISVSDKTKKEIKPESKENFKPFDPVEGLTNLFIDINKYYQKEARGNLCENPKDKAKSIIFGFRHRKQEEREKASKKLKTVVLLLEVCKGDAEFQKVYHIHKVLLDELQDKYLKSEDCLTAESGMSIDEEIKTLKQFIKELKKFYIKHFSERERPSFLQNRNETATRIINGLHQPNDTKEYSQAFESFEEITDCSAKCSKKPGFNEIAHKFTKFLVHLHLINQPE